MARSKFVTGGLIASVIWLIVGSVGIFFRNSEEARLANAAARSSCRGEENFSACLEAYYAANGGAPGIDWVWILTALAIGLAVIWAIVFVLMAVGRGRAAE